MSVPCPSLRPQDVADGYGPAWALVRQSLLRKRRAAPSFLALPCCQTRSGWVGGAHSNEMLIAALGEAAIGLARLLTKPRVQCSEAFACACAGLLAPTLVRASSASQ